MIILNKNRWQVGWMLTDDEDYCDKLLIRIWGFTVLGIWGGSGYSVLGITILGLWISKIL